MNANSSVRDYSQTDEANRPQMSKSYRKVHSEISEEIRKCISDRKQQLTVTFDSWKVIFPGTSMSKRCTLLKRATRSPLGEKTRLVFLSFPSSDRSGKEPPKSHTLASLETFDRNSLVSPEKTVEKVKNNYLVDILKILQIHVKCI